MFTNTNTLFLHAITSVHAGSGSEVGLVDLPIQREKQTGYPKLESSSLKGSVREYFESRYSQDTNEIDEVFGSKDNADTRASAISFSDARLLLFPIRSLKGVFVWITCPYVLKRFNREVRTYYGDGALQLTVPNENTISTKELIVANNQIVLEEYAHKVDVTEDTTTLAKELSNIFNPYLVNEIEERLVVLDDYDFSNYVNLSTEVNARIKIGDDGITSAGALWYEENVPAESIFYFTIFSGQVRVLPDHSNNTILKSVADVENYMKEKFPKSFQVGGHYTLGKGLMKTIWLEEDLRGGL